MICLEALSGLLKHRYGVRPQRGWEREIPRVCAKLLGPEGCRAGALASAAHLDEALLHKIAAGLSIAETFFFRHAAHFEALTDHLRPYLGASEGRPVKILSLGCATGEETYSMAIAIQRAFGPPALARAEITGVDLSHGSIEKAAAGRYQAWSFREAPAWLVGGCFMPVGEGRYELFPELRAAVRFETRAALDYLNELPDRSLDAVFFRNVAIYLGRSARGEIFQALSRVLRPGGLLALAPGDPRPAGMPLEKTDHESTSVYLATGGQASPARPPKAPSTPAPAPAPPAPLHASAIAPRQSAQALIGRAEALGPPEPWTPIEASGYLTRAQARAADEGWDTAVEDLRRAVYFDASHRIARYWLALGLHTLGEQALARRQLRELRRLLQSSSLEAPLEDGLTQPEELARAVDFLEERLS